MEPNVINPREVEGLTGEDRDNWFWDHLDRLRQANVNLVSEVDMLTKMVDTRNEMLDKARADQVRHGEEIIEMGKQLNAARSAAATSVKDYIALTEA